MPLNYNHELVLSNNYAVQREDRERRETSHSRLLTQSREVKDQACFRVQNDTSEAC